MEYNHEIEELRNRCRRAENELVRLKELETREKHIKNVLLAIRNVNKMIVQENDPQQLIEKACQNLTESMGYKSALIAMLEEGEKNVISTASSGFDSDFENAIRQLSRNEMTVCMKQALKMNSAAIYEDPESSCADCPLFREYGEWAGMARRLNYKSRIFGILVVSVSSGFVDSKEEQALFNEVADDLGYALYKIETEVLLHESQWDLKRAQDLANIGSWLFDLNSNTVYASEKAREIYGIESTDVTVPDIQTFRLPQYHSMLDEALKNLVNHNTPYDVEFEIQRPSDNAIRYIHSIAEFDSEKNHVIGTIQDITALKQAENEVQQQVHRLKALTDIQQYNADTVQEFLDNALEKAISLTNSKIGYIYLYNEDNRQFELNTWSKDVMKECRVINPMTVYNLDSTGIWGEAIRQRKAIMINDFKADNPLKKGCPEGHVQLERFLTIPVFQQKQIVAVVGVANKQEEYRESDILELTLLMDAAWKSVENINARDTLKERENYLSTIIQTTVDGFFLLDRKGQIFEVNDAYCEMIGYSREELLKRNISDIESIESQEEIERLIEKIVKKRSDIFETHHRCKDGKLIPLEISITYMEEYDGRIICFARDLSERIDAEDALRKSEEKFRGIAENFTDALFITDNKGTIDFISPSSEVIFGYQPAEMVGTAFTDHLKKDQIPIATEKFMNTIQTGARTVNLSLEMKHKNGEYFWGELSASIFNVSETNIGTLGVISDITERKKAEKDLRESEERNRILNDVTIEGILIHRNGIAIDLNNSLARMLGYENRDELIGVDFKEYVHKNDIEIIKKNILKNNCAPYTIQMQRRNGEYFFTEIESKNVSMANKSFRVTAIRDITERRKAEEEIRLQALVLDQISDHVTITDLNGIITYVNDAEMRSLGYSREELIGSPTRIYGEDPELGASQRQILNETLKHGFWRGEIVNMAADDRKIIMDCRAQVVHDLEGNAIALCGVSTDITEQKRADAELRAAHETMRLAADAAEFGVWELNLETGHLEWDDWMLRLYGITKEDFGNSYDSWAERADKDDLKRVDIELQHTLQGETVFDTEFRVFRGDGEIRYIKAHAKVKRDNDDKAVSMIGVNYDITERKRAEEELLKKSEAMEASSQGMAILNAEQEFIYLNKAHATIYGYNSTSEMLGKSWHILYHEDELNRFKEEIFPVFLRDGFWNGEAVGKKKDGSRFPQEVSLTALHGGELICVVQDISERKTAEEAIRESETRFQKMLGVVPDMISIHDTDMNILYSNWQGFADIPSERRERLAKCYTAYHNLEDVCPDCQLQSVLASRSPSQRDVNTPQGKWLDVRIIPLLDKSGDIEMFMEWVRDITGHKLAVEALKESEERFRLLIENLPDEVYVHDFDGNFVLVNQVACRNTGYSIEELMSLSLYDIDPETEQRKDKEKYWHTLNTNETNLVSGQHLRKDGSVYPVELLINRMSLKDMPVILAVARDLSDREEAEEEKNKLREQLVQAQKMESVGRLAGGVAHDFNNMLNVIILNTEILLENEAGNESIRDELEQIKHAAQRSADLTRQLLAFARKQTVTPKVLDLNETITSMLKMLRRLIGEDINLKWMPSDTIKPVRMDPSQINQILANLLVNSRDAIGHNIGRISIETQLSELDEDYCRINPECVPGTYVTLAVSDDGCGMDIETRNKIFEPFYTTKAQGEGTGLGLATVYGIVKQNNGYINVYSEPGQGTIFRIYLPVYSKNLSDDQDSTESNSKIQSGNEVILLVEDEADILSISTRILSRLGYQILSAPTPGEAITLAEEYPGNIDLLITDVIMPEMNGRDLAKRLLSIYPDIKRLFMSGYTADVIAHQGVLDEGVNFLQKPFSLQQFGKKVRECLDE